VSGDECVCVGVCESGGVCVCVVWVCLGMCVCVGGCACMIGRVYVCVCGCVRVCVCVGFFDVGVLVVFVL